MREDDICFLHRHGAHVFITTRDPEYRYEWLCGHCDYPVTADEPCCPRCQRALECCPVCSQLRHVRVPRVPREAVGGHTCPTCGVRRIPFGDRPLEHVGGSFCTNIYGCPAGGLLLRSDEFAVLPAGATLCPVCRDEGFRPLDIRTFVYHVTRCLFCCTCYQAVSSWKPGWGRGSDALDRLGEASQEGDVPCALCGRCDKVEADKTDAHASRVAWRGVSQQSQDRANAAPAQTYLRMAELGRILILEPSRHEAFTCSFNLWFEPGYRPGERVEGPTVGEIATDLLEGTLLPAPRRVLQQRVAEFLGSWQASLPRGLAYRIPLTRAAVSSGAAGVWS